MRLHVATLLLVIAVVPVTRGDAAGPPRHQEELAIKRTVRLAMTAALREGNFSRACRFASEKGRLRLIVGFSWFDQTDYKTCEQVIGAQIRNPFSRTIVASLRRRIVLAHLRLRGTRARISVGYRRGRDADSTWVSLRRVSGEWRVTNSGWIPPPRGCGCEP
jgi:hypothetical protein